jgi:lipopolysaccharide export system protein LptA
MCLAPSTRLKSLLFGVGLWALSASIFAETPAPVEVTADRAVYDETASTVTYLGNVVLTQADTVIRSASLKIKEIAQEDGTTHRAIAEGSPVRFRHLDKTDGKEITGEAQRMEYAVDLQQVTLIGDAKLVQEGDTLTSDRVVYNLTTRIAKAGASAQGKDRVRTIIQPEKP